MRDAGLVLLLGALACAGGDAKGVVDAATQTASPAAPSQDSTDTQTSHPLRLARLEERAPTTFPHAPHLRFDCRRCHAQVAGHERHANVPCRQCHEAPAPTTTGASASDCSSCHHASNQAFDCVHCHDRDPATRPAPQVRLTLRLAGHDATRSVSFPHARHAGLSCTRCHLHADRASAAAQCNGCHESHHRAGADCAACHSPPREGVHSAAVHRGCGGEGCHQNPAVLALPLARNVCLACHPAQAQHEPGGNCATCHNLRLPAAGQTGAA